MKYAEEEIRSLILRFEAGILPKKEWTHEAHLVAAIWFCTQYPINEAIRKIRNCIIKHNEAVGTPNNDRQGYHETITLFWMNVAHRFIETRKTLTLTDLCNAFIGSEYGTRDYILKFYSSPRIFDKKARKNWVGPDKLTMNID